MITRHADGKPYVSTHKYVDSAFLERLHVLDPDLEPRWNPARCKWEIWRQGKYILTVQSSTEEYRHLDNRTLIQLFKCDTKYFANSRQFIQSLHIEDHRLMGGKRKEQDNFMRDCSADMAPLMRKRKSVDINPKNLNIAEDN